MERSTRPARPGRRAAVGALLAPPLAWLAGCSPEHDWREIRAEDQGFLVMLPAKPARMTRSIRLEDLTVEMAMVGAQARALAYTVATVMLPDASEATRVKGLAAMRTAMVRNIGGAIGAERRVPVLRVDAAGQRTGTVEGVEIEAEGRMREREATLIARFVAVGAQAWQAVVLGPRPDREQATLFLESLKLIR
jgi:hypothetical protein